MFRSIFFGIGSAIFDLTGNFFAFMMEVAGGLGFGSMLNVVMMVFGVACVFSARAPSIPFVDDNVTALLAIHFDVVAVDFTVVWLEQSSSFTVGIVLLNMIGFFKLLALIRRNFPIMGSRWWPCEVCWIVKIGFGVKLQLFFSMFPNCFPVSRRCNRTIGCHV